MTEPYRMLPTPRRFVVAIDAMGGPRFFCIHPRATHAPREPYDVSTTGSVDLAWVCDDRDSAEAFLDLAIGGAGMRDVFPGRPRVMTIGMARFLAEDACMQPSAR